MPPNVVGLYHVQMETNYDHNGGGQGRSGHGKFGRMMHSLTKSLSSSSVTAQSSAASAVPAHVVITPQFSSNTHTGSIPSTALQSVPSAMQIMQAQAQAQSLSASPVATSVDHSCGSAPIFSVGSSSPSKSRRKGLFRKGSRCGKSAATTTQSRANNNAKAWINPTNDNANQRPKPKRSSSVTFSSSPPQVAETISLSDLQPHEKSSMWYDTSEVIGFRSAIRAVSAKIRLSALQRVEDDRAAGRDPNSLTMLRQYRAKSELDLRRKPAHEESVLCSGASPAGASNHADLMAKRDGGTAPVPAAISPTPSQLSATVSFGRPAGLEEVAAASTCSPPEEMHDGDEISEGEHETFRGLEHRISFERQRNKLLAMRSVLGLHHTIKARKAAAAAKAWNAAMTEENTDIITTEGVNHASGPNRMPVTNPTSRPLSSTTAQHSPSSPSSSLNDIGMSPPTAKTLAHAKDCFGSDDSNREAQVLASFTSKVNQYAALVAARTAQQDFAEAYPDIAAARRRMSDQVISIPKQRLPMRSCEEVFGSSSDSDDDSIIDMDESDVTAARRMGGRTGSRRQSKLGKRKSWANVMDGKGESSRYVSIEGGHDSLVGPREAERSTILKTNQVSLPALPSSGSAGRLLRLEFGRSGEKSQSSVRGNGQQLEVEAGQSRKRRSITLPLVEVMEKFSLEEMEKDED